MTGPADATGGATAPDGAHGDASTAPDTTVEEVEEANALASEADRGPERIGESSGAQLLRSSGVVAAGTMLSRVTGLVRTAAQLAALGTLAVGDTFFAANTAPNLLYDLLLGGVLAATLIPVFVGNLERGDDDGTAAVVTVLGSALAVLTVVAMACSPLLAAVFAAEPERRSLLTLLLLLLLPQIFFYGLSTIANGLLNSRKRFAAAAFAPVANNIVAIGVLAWFALALDGSPTIEALSEQTGLVLVLGLGTTAGIAVQALLLVPAVRRSGVRWRWRFDWHHPAVRTVVRLSGWTMGYVLANQVSLWLITVLAYRGGDGDLTAYNAAYQFFQLPYGLLAVSVITAFMPDMALLAGRRDRAGFSDRFLTALRLVLLLVLPCAVALALLSQPLVSVLLERGDVTAGGADRIADALTGFSVGLPFFCVYLLAMRGFYAHQDTRRPFWLNLGENAGNVLLAVALVGLGAAGLALSFSLAYVVAAVAALVVLHRAHGGMDWSGEVSGVARVLVAAAAMAAAIVGVTAWGPDGAWARVVIGGAVGGLTYVVAVLVLRVPGATGIAKVFSR